MSNHTTFQLPPFVPSPIDRASFGVVYVVRTTTEPIEYKIGFTRAGIRHRIACLKYVLKQDILLVHTIECDYPEGLERALHRRYQEQHIKGEWFSLSDQDLAYIKSLTEFLGRTITLP